MAKACESLPLLAAILLVREKQAPGIEFAGMENIPYWIIFTVDTGA